jgi:hypothetical protein
MVYPSCSNLTALLNSTSPLTNDTSYETYPIVNLLGNFSQMSVENYLMLNSTGPGSHSLIESAENLSYSIVARPVINGSEFYEVNITAPDSGGFPTVGPSTMTIFFLPNGTATEVIEGPFILSGENASLAGESFMEEYFATFMPDGQQFYSITSSSPSNILSSFFIPINSSIITLGNVRVNQTVYSLDQNFLRYLVGCLGLNQSVLNQVTLQETYGAGPVLGRNFQIMTFTYESEATRNASMVMMMKILSMTANPISIPSPSRSALALLAGVSCSIFLTAVSRRLGLQRMRKMTPAALNL